MRKLAILPFLFLTGLATAQENSDCFDCHDDVEFTGERAGVEVSFHVDPTVFAGSVHGDFDCIDCHQDLAGVDFHEDDVESAVCDSCHDSEAEEAARSVHSTSRGGSLSCTSCHGSHDIAPLSEKPVECASCHRRQVKSHRASLHGQAALRGDPLAPTCADCHGAHDVRASDDRSSPTAVMNIPLLCGRCHREGSPVSMTHEVAQDRILENYSMSIHGRGLFQQGLTVTAVCTSCHTSHDILDHDDPSSTIHRDNVARTCATCHGQIEQVHRQVIEGRLWEEEPHKIPACVDCHSPHKIRQVRYVAGTSTEDCLSCHGQSDLSMERDGETVSLFVDREIHQLSAHGETACAQCHVDITPSLDRPCESVSNKVPRERVDCAICHAEQVEDYQQSTHGTLFAAGDTDAPYCLDCHDKHATLEHTLPNSPTFARNVPAVCGTCHRVGEKAAVRIDSEVPDILASYNDSIHGKGLIESGLLVTATCADCHTAHRELPPGNPDSTVNRANIASTCGRCHHGIEERFRTSVHWPGNTETERELPTCEDCHSSHTIGRTDHTGFRTRMMDQCGRCHESEAATFFDTFHGKVSRLGSEAAAECYDCHGSHEVLPVSDPASTLGRDNVVATCGQCHEGSHRRFAGYLTHATHHDSEKYPWLFWSFWGMTVLLVGTLTVALSHTLAWLLRLWLSRDEWKAHRARVKVSKETKHYRRFNRFQRLLHLLMMISFFTLALTGMALKFSYMTWAQSLSWALGGFETMGILHRLGGLLLFVVFGLHLHDVWRKKKASGRTWLGMICGWDSIVFNQRDFGELLASAKWFFGLGPRPKYGRYTYWEKFDYFAVFWGVLVIGSTGLILWFPELFTRVLPGWSVNVATIIHSDEALLAVAFIFTIHFFNTHFRPDKFPMDPVIFTGRVTLDELRYDKPEEYEQLVARGEIEDQLVGPFPREVEKGLRFFGFVALGIGLILIALIVYSMLLGYR